MANRDQNWGFGGRGGGDRGRRDEGRRNERGRGPEQRSFGDDRREQGGEPWRGESRYGARYDQDRTGYGAVYDQDERGGYDSQRGGYRGQEYGMEGGRDHRTTGERDPAWRGDERETWRPGGGEPYGDLELNARNRGIQEFGAPHDYAYHPQAGHEFDPDYLHWREEQMRRHDRDYHAWRGSQQQSYDQDYRNFRDQRREHFGRSFAEWRSQRSAVGGVPDTSAAGGVSGYGAKTGTPTGYDADQGSKPSGMIEPSTAMNASPGASQTGGSAGGGEPGASGGTGDTSPEFGKASPQVQASAQGWDGRGAPEDKLRKDEDKEKR